MENFRQVKRVIVWFRNDLRLHDNESLMDALSSAEEVIPVFIFDDRIYKSYTSFGFPKTGRHRMRFLLESIAALNSNLEKLSTRLIIRTGITEDIIFELAKEFKTRYVFCNRERTDEEVKIQDTLEKKLWSIGQEMRYSRGKMLYFTADLPFPITQAPETFYQYKKEVKRFIPIREPIEKPNFPFNPLSILIDSEPLPSIDQFLKVDDTLHNEENRWKGGENEAIQYMTALFDLNQDGNFKSRIKGKHMDDHFSSGLSPWLSNGSLSPKLFYMLYAQKQGTNRDEKDINGLEQLLWRDFYRLLGKKHGNAIFQKGGILRKSIPHTDTDRSAFNQWVSGETGNIIVDAHMRELYHTGWISHMGRKWTAYYLLNELKLDWRMGAEYFESILIDYDPCSNYGNWNHMAGLMEEQGDSRIFNMENLAGKYDHDHAFIQYWLQDKFKIEYH